MTDRKTKLEPLYDRIVVRRADPEKVTPGGIIIPDNARPKPARGEVLAVGPGRTHFDRGDFATEALDVNVGDVVYFPEYSGTVIEQADGPVLVLGAHEVLARVVPA